MRKFNIYLDDGKIEKLTEHDLANSGGEGEIFLKNGFAYKIYFDKSKVISPSKIKELSMLDKDNIIRPIQSIKDSDGNYIGYQMKALKSDKCYPLTRFFTTDFRLQHGVTDQDITHLVKNLYLTFEFIHNKGFLIVDGNEMNFLVSDDFKEIYFIDVDSYKTPSFKPTAFNPNTLDPLVKANKFNENSDWYIFAILFSQIVLGIHPFKGKYTGVSRSFGKRDITKRMKEGVSVLDPKIKLNKAVRSLSLIPESMRNWLDSMFKNESRVKPPLLSSAINVMNKIVDIFDVPKGFKVFESLELKDYADDFYRIGKEDFFKKDNKFFSNDTGQVISSAINAPLTINGMLSFVKLENNNLSMYIPKLNIIQEIYNDIEKFYIFNNEVFVYRNNKLSNLDIMIVGKKIMTGMKTSWDLYHHQNINNLILFYQSGKRKAYYFYEFGKNAIIDIDKFVESTEKVVNIKGFNNFIVVKTIKNNEYFTKIISIDLFSKETTLVLTEHSENTSINFVLNKSLLIGQLNDEDLIIGALKNNLFNEKRINDFTLNKKLFMYDDKISFIDKNKVYGLTMS